jgi:hypothetical protein
LLRGGYVAGQANQADHDRHAARLAAARRRYDLLAAVRAAGPANIRDHAVLDRLAARIRGGHPQSGEVEQAVAEFDSTEPAAPGATALGIGFPFTRLVSGETDAIQFVEFGPDAISVVTLAANEFGVPDELPEASRAVSWPQVCRELPADADLRRLWLAGGIGEPGPGDPQELSRQIGVAAAQAVRRLLTDAAVPVRSAVARTRRAARNLEHIDRVLVRRTHGWPLLDEAIAEGNPAVQPVAEIVELGTALLSEIAFEAAARAPLRYEYAAMLVQISPQGRVSVEPYPLFPAGTVLRSYDQPTKSLPLQVPPAAAPRLTVPVVAKRGTDMARWPEVGTAIIEGAPAGSRKQLRVQLRRPGQINFRPPPLTAGKTVPRWPEVLNSVPEELSSDAPADLVLLVELGGAAAAATARLDLLDALLARIERQDVRVAVVGYRDHHIHKGQVEASDLDALASARRTLTDLRHWNASGFGDDYAAPLEDALHWVATRSLGWRQRARHLLLVCGGRPPHGHSKASSPPSYCPNWHDWDEILIGLRQEQSAEVIAVVGPGALEYRAMRVWERVCAAGKPPLTADTTSADDLLRALGLAAGDTGDQLYLARWPEGPRLDGWERNE